MSDTTALQRQHRRIERLKEQGVTRTTLLIHGACKPALEGLRHHFVNPEKAAALASLVAQLHDKKAPTNVAQVRQLSPFRYPNMAGARGAHMADGFQGFSFGVCGALRRWCDGGLVGRR
ncbi:MAG TPA: hypothetical protein ACQGQX_06125 [Xylella taiwanensis]